MMYMYFEILACMYIPKYVYVAYTGLPMLSRGAGYHTKHMVRFCTRVDHIS